MFLLAEGYGEAEMYWWTNRQWDILKLGSKGMSFMHAFSWLVDIGVRIWWDGYWILIYGQCGEESGCAYVERDDEEAFRGLPEHDWVVIEQNEYVSSIAEA